MERNKGAGMLRKRYMWNVVSEALNVLNVNNENMEQQRIQTLTGEL